MLRSNTVEFTSGGTRTAMLVTALALSVLALAACNGTTQTPVAAYQPGHDTFIDGLSGSSTAPDRNMLYDANFGRSDL